MADPRNNETWIRDLSVPGSPREQALADLRTTLVRSLPRGLARWLGPGNPGFDSLLEDTVQETLLRVIAGLDQFEGRSQFTTWAYKIAVRLALNQLRKREWRSVSLDQLEQPIDEGKRPREFAFQEASPESQAELSDTMERVQQIMMEELTERQRTALMAVIVHGMPMEEVARRLETNRNALYKLLHDGRVRLKKRLEDEGLAPGDMVEMLAAK